MPDPANPETGLPLTAAEKKAIQDKIDALEKREIVTKADVEKIVSDVLAKRDAAKPPPAAEEEEW